MRKQLQDLAVLVLTIGVGIYAVVGHQNDMKTAAALKQGQAQLQRQNVRLQRQSMRLRRQEAALEQSQTISCIAGNVQHATDNASHLADYRFITQQVEFTQSSLHANYLALRHIGIGKQVLNRALAQSEASLRSQKAEAAAKTWTALADCAAPATRLSELRVYSIAAVRPPRSALSVKNALRVNPVGSVH